MRLRMPHNNRVNASSALRTNDMWSKTIGFDPHAPSESSNDQDEKAIQEQTASFLLLAKMSNLSGSESRGGCKKCGMLGHLTFQCRNNIKLESSKPDEEPYSDSSGSEGYEEKDDDNNGSNIVKNRSIEKNVNKRRYSRDNDDDNNSTQETKHKSKHHKKDKKHKEKKSKSHKKNKSK